MARDNEYAGAVGNSTNDVPRESAHASLRRHAGLDGVNEGTPLLRNNDTAREPAQWEGSADLEGLPWYKKPSVFWLLPPFCLFATAIGGIIVPKLNLILSLVCREYLIERSASDPSLIFAPVILGGENPQCRIPEVQALATEFNLVLTIIVGTLSAIMSPKLGSFSDRYGRRKMLLVTSCGAFATEVITIFIAKFPDRVHYRWFLLGAVFDGLCGSFTAGMAISYAYAADCTAPPRRVVAFGYLRACLDAGVAMGPILAGLLFKFTGSLLTIFYMALGFQIVFLIFIALVVPESLSKARQKLAKEKHAAVLDARAREEPSWISSLKRFNILEPLKVLWPTGPGTSNYLRSNLILLAGVDTVTFGVGMGAMAVVVYYTGYQFGWDTGDTSLFVSIVSITRVSGLLILVPGLNYIFRTRKANRQRRESGFALPEPNSGSDNLDLGMIRAAVLFEFFGFTGFALSRTSLWFVVSGIVNSLGGMGSPALSSSLTKHVPHDRVGSVMGALGLLHALTRVFCPLVFNLIYAKTVGTYRQAVFVVLSGCFGVAFLFTWLIRPHVYLEEPSEATEESESAQRADVNREVQLEEEITGM